MFRVGRCKLSHLEWINNKVLIYSMGFPSGSVLKNLPAKAGDSGSILGLGRSCERNGSTIQYSCLANPMGRGAWWARVHGVDKESNVT